MSAILVPLQQVGDGDRRIPKCYWPALLMYPGTNIKEIFLKQGRSQYLRLSCDLYTHTTVLTCLYFHTNMHTQIYTYTHTCTRECSRVCAHTPTHQTCFYLSRTLLLGLTYLFPMMTNAEVI